MSSERKFCTTNGWFDHLAACVKITYRTECKNTTLRNTGRYCTPITHRDGVTKNYKILVDIMDERIKEDESLTNMEISVIRNPPAHTIIDDPKWFEEGKWQ